MNLRLASYGIIRYLITRMDKTSELFQDLNYLKGFGNGFASEAKEGAIPKSNLFIQIISTKQSSHSQIWTVSWTTLRHCIHSQKGWKSKSVVLQAEALRSGRTVQKINIPFQNYLQLPRKRKLKFQPQPTQMEDHSLSKGRESQFRWRLSINNGIRRAFFKVGFEHLCL